MASLLRPNFYLLALTCALITCSFIEATNTQLLSNQRHFSSRKLLDIQQQDQDQDQEDVVGASAAVIIDQDLPIKKKTPNNLSLKNQTKTIKNGSPKNQTKLLNLTTTTSLPKNKTKLIKPTTTSTQPTFKTKLNTTSKPSNSTKPKPKDHSNEEPMTQKPIQPIWVDVEIGDDDLISEFTDLTTRFQQNLLPDLEKISSTSKIYIKKANKEITNNVAPIVGKKYAPLIASIVSCAFILIPLILASFIFNRIKAYFSLQKILSFIHIYLYIYFFILSLSGLLTGLEPLRCFYKTSPTIYIFIQVVQTLAYMLYLLLVAMYMILVFSMNTGLGSKVLSLGQTFVGFAVGLHYYVTVFHRALLHQVPKTSWKVQAVYATCFFVICLLDRFERRKKAYLEDDGSEGKKC
ncbi:uncharacterized protein LOC141672130 [Apium graveolens]|uniref:uncharacterized protein LOC141672130 n=1 Tax=Apium graveolens TaxID=4045 RepID=UPI003D7A763A